MTSNPCESSVAPSSIEGDEEQVTELVRLFYSHVHKDSLIGPVFESFVKDWDRHMQDMRDFWSMHLLGTDRYKHNAFAAHMRLPIEDAHFERWLALWEESARQSLPPHLAERAIKRGRHMAQSFRTGLLPYKRADGGLSRTP